MWASRGSRDVQRVWDFSPTARDGNTAREARGGGPILSNTGDGSLTSAARFAETPPPRIYFFPLKRGGRESRGRSALFPAGFILEWVHAASGRRPPRADPVPSRAEASSSSPCLAGPDQPPPRSPAADFPSPGPSGTLGSLTLSSRGHRDDTDQAMSDPGLWTLLSNFNMPQFFSGARLRRSKR